MGTPKASLMGRLTKEGRLKKQWTRGLEGKNVSKSLNELRYVQQNLLKSPENLGHLWVPFLVTYMDPALILSNQSYIRDEIWIPFLETYLDPARVDMLSESDMAALMDMVNIIEKYPSSKLHAEDVRQRIVKILDARKEELQARAFLIRMNRSLSTSKDRKAECVLGLDRRGAKEDELINNYIYYLRQIREPSKELDFRKFLSNICAVDFDTDTRMLKYAGKVARHLANNDIHVENMQSALGLNALIIENDPSKALIYFDTAVKLTPFNRVAAIGLLTCLLRTGNYSRMSNVIKNIYQDNITAGLVELGNVLKWFNDLQAEGPAPCTAASLSVYDIGEYAGVTLESAIGMLHLLEGDAIKAFEILSPLASRCPENYQLCYYTAWSVMLSGDVEVISDYFDSLCNWETRWAIICLIVDTNTKMLKKTDLLSRLSQYQGTFSSVVSTRIALILGTLPNKPNWIYDPKDWRYDPKGELAERLEALRTSIGYAVYMRDREAAQKAISMHIFRRLPIADQLLWRGLYELTFNNSTDGLTLLKEAADKYVYPRAALIISVHLLEQDKIQESLFWLDKASQLENNTKIELLLAYLEVCEGKMDTASDMLEILAADGDARAYYALGNLYMQRADIAIEEGDDQRCFQYRNQAAKAFQDALGAQNGIQLPRDLTALAICCEFLANPDNIQGSYHKLWEEVEKLDSITKMPWLSWIAFITQLWYGTPSGIISSGENAIKLPGLIELLVDSELAAVSSAIAYSCIEADNATDMYKLIMLLDFLSSGSRKKVVKQYYRLCVATLARKLVFDKTLSRG